MTGEPARGWNPDPQRAPAPPVTTRPVHSDAPDPGAAGGRLPPFRPGSAGSSPTEKAADLGFEPGIDMPFVSADFAPESAPDVPVERSDESDLEPADVRLDADSYAEYRPAERAYEPEDAEPAAHALEANLEDARLLDEVVDADESGTELSAREPWPQPDVPGLELDIAPIDAADDADIVLEVGEADAADEASATTDTPRNVRSAETPIEVEPLDPGEGDVVLELEPADADEESTVVNLERLVAGEPDTDEEAWDPLGEALEEAVTRADPPFAEDLVRSMDPKDAVIVDEPHETVPAPPAAPAPWETRVRDADVGAPVDRPAQSRPPRDGFTEDLVATLESLAGSLRARGFNALDDAFAHGDRLEASLALFLAGYRAGRGE